MEVAVKEEQKESYKPVFITIQLSSETNKLLSESAARSHRKKLQEATIRLDDHLMRFHSISEKGKTVPSKISTENKSSFIENNIKEER